MFKSNKKHPKTLSGEKYPTQWDDEAKNNEKTKIFKAFFSLNKSPGRFWEQFFLSLSRKKARFIFVFIIFLNLFNFLAGK